MTSMAGMVSGMHMYIGVGWGGVGLGRMGDSTCTWVVHSDLIEYDWCLYMTLKFGCHVIELFHFFVLFRICWYTGISFS